MEIPFCVTLRPAISVQLQQHQIEAVVGFYIGSETATEAKVRKKKKKSRYNCNCRPYQAHDYTVIPL